MQYGNSVYNKKKQNYTKFLNSNSKKKEEKNLDNYDNGNSNIAQSKILKPSDTLNSQYSGYFNNITDDINIERNNYENNNSDVKQNKKKESSGLINVTSQNNTEINIISNLLNKSNKRKSGESEIIDNIINSNINKDKDELMSNNLNSKSKDYKQDTRTPIDLSNETKWNDPKLVSLISNNSEQQKLTSKIPKNLEILNNSVKETKSKGSNYLNHYKCNRAKSKRNCSKKHGQTNIMILPHATTSTTTNNNNLRNILFIDKVTYSRAFNNLKLLKSAILHTTNQTIQTLPTENGDNKKMGNNVSSSYKMLNTNSSLYEALRKEERINHHNKEKNKRIQMMSDSLFKRKTFASDKERIENIKIKIEGEKLKKEIENCTFKPKLTRHIRSAFCSVDNSLKNSSLLASYNNDSIHGPIRGNTYDRTTYWRSQVNSK